ncbi:MAG: MATE family efflux transporter [Aquificae bacterium]|nr:MATE family efflux transporter [Aquificota bacterium]
MQVNINPKIKKVLLLAVPVAISNLIDMLQMLVDLLMVGRISPQAIAAVGMSIQFMGLIYVLASPLSIGTNALVSRFIGAKKREEADKVLFIAAIFAFLVSIPIAIIGVFYSKYIFLLMGTSEDVAKVGEQYFSILSLTILIIFMGAVFYAGIYASGDSKTPLKIGILTNIINAVLDYILIFGKFNAPELGVKGAAIATLIAYFIDLLLFLYIFVRNKTNISLKINSEFSYIKRILNVGIPAGIERFLTYLSFIVFVRIISEYGTYTLAGYQVGLRIEGLAFMPGLGFSTAAMALVGQSLGANKPKEAQEYAKITANIAAIFMGIFGILMILFPYQLASIFTQDEKTLQEASLYIRLVGFSQVPLAYVFVLTGVLRGAGATRLSLVVNVTSQWVFRILPSIIIMKLSSKIIWIYVIMNMETYITALWLWYIFKLGKWKKIKV